AVGARTDYFGVRAAPEYCLKLETMRDTMAIMKSVQRKLAEAADLLKEEPDNPRLEALLNFAIIGGGPTGIELAFDFRYFLGKMVRLRFPGLASRPPRLMIFEAGPHILNGFSEAERDYVTCRLLQHGIALHVNHRVLDVQPDHIRAAVG